MKPDLAASRQMMPFLLGAGIQKADVVAMLPVVQWTVSALAEDKLTRYLLLPQARGDKSAFLAKAGYTPGNVDQLLQDLRTQILACEVVALESNKFCR